MCKGIQCIQEVDDWKFHPNLSAAETCWGFQNSFSKKVDLIPGYNSCVVLQGFERIVASDTTNKRYAREIWLLNLQNNSQKKNSKHKQLYLQQACFSSQVSLQKFKTRHIFVSGSCTECHTCRWCSCGHCSKLHDPAMGSSLNRISCCHRINTWIPVSSG